MSALLHLYFLATLFVLLGCQKTPIRNKRNECFNVAWFLVIQFLYLLNRTSDQAQIPLSCISASSIKISNTKLAHRTTLMLK